MSIRHETSDYTLADTVAEAVPAPSFIGQLRNDLRAFVGPRDGRLAQEVDRQLYTYRVRIGEAYAANPFVNDKKPFIEITVPVDNPRKAFVTQYQLAHTLDGKPPVLKPIQGDVRLPTSLVEAVGCLLTAVNDTPVFRDLRAAAGGDKGRSSSKRELACSVG